MSEAVERKILALLGHPTRSPYGNPIPGLEELGERGEEHSGGVSHVAEVATSEPRPWRVHRIGEPAQSHTGMLALLHEAGISPGTTVTVERRETAVCITAAGSRAAQEGAVLVPMEVASHIFVTVEAAEAEAVASTA